MFNIDQNRLTSWWNSKLLKLNQPYPSNEGYDTTSKDEDDLIVVLYGGHYNNQNNSTVKLKSIFPALIIDPNAKIILHYCDLLDNDEKTNKYFECAIYINEIAKNHDNVQLVLAISCNNLEKGYVYNVPSWLSFSHFRVDPSRINYFSIGVITFDIQNVKNNTNCINLSSTGISTANIQSTIVGLLKGWKPISNGTHVLEPNYNTTKIIIEDLLRRYSGDKEYPFVLNLRNTPIVSDDRIIVQNDTDLCSALVKINQNLVDFFVMKIHNHVIAIENSSNDYQYIHSELQLVKSNLENIIIKITNHSLITIPLVESVIKNLNLTISEKDVQYIRNSNQVINFVLDIKKRSDEEYRGNISSCNSLQPYEIKELFNNREIVHAVTYYNFLNELYTWLSEYYVQKNTNQYNEGLNHVQDEIKRSLNPSETVDINNVIHQFTTKFASNSDRLQITDSIKDVTLSPKRVAFLNKILDWTLKDETKLFCNDKELVIKGKYIILSNFTNHYCIEEKENIKIYALNTIFVDADLNLTQISFDDLYVYMIAPKWEVVGNHTITLDGSDNNYYQHKKPVRPTTSGSSGKYGDPGLPGYSGGYFLGIGKTFINSENLVISSNGGQGQRGQDGGDGSDGIDGKDFISDDTVEFEYVKLSRKNCQRYGITFTLKNKNDPDANEPLFSKRNALVSNYFLYYTNRNCYSQCYIEPKNALSYTNYTNKLLREYLGERDLDIHISTNRKLEYKNVRIYKYCIYGTQGTRGGDGGNGGSGGIGGKPGIINIIGLDSNNIPKISVNNFSGLKGKDGLAGKGGKGGKYGDDIIAYYINFYPYEDGYQGFCYSRWFDEKEVISSNTYALPGTPGIYGNNTKGIIEPKEVVSYDRNVTNEYTSYVVENLNGLDFEPKLTDFFNDLKNNKDIIFTTKYNKRKRRSVDSYQSIENIRPISSGSSSNMHSSLIKSISDLFHKSFLRLNPISRISNWFSKDRNNVYQEILNMLDNNLLYGKMINIEYSSIELPPSLPRISDNKSSTNVK
ncbi:hypothetical protein ACRRVD_01105 [Candidatus Cardinium hertigii]|uniref:hypothetical protein n=1 Tax=Candidatus Cardinium hertigii TaxID=247481 RepID=UPI003D7CB3B1